VGLGASGKNLDWCADATALLQKCHSNEILQSRRYRNRIGAYAPLAERSPNRAPVAPPSLRPGLSFPPPRVPRCVAGLKPLPDQQPDALVIVQLAFLSLEGKPRHIRTITAGVPALCTPLVACRAALACSAYLLRRVLRCFLARGQSPLQRKAVQHVTKHGIVTLFSGAGVCSGVLFASLSEGRHGGNPSQRGEAPTR
jgi:hypothetical protein